MISTLDMTASHGGLPPKYRRQIVSDSSAEERSKLAERTGPAVTVAVAGVFVGELLMSERQGGRAAIGLEFNRHQGLALRRAAPRPGENQLTVRHHFAEHAADIMLLTARRAH